MKNKIGSNAPWKSTTICTDTETNTKTRWYIPLELSFIKTTKPKKTTSHELHKWHRIEWNDKLTTESSEILTLLK